MKEESFVTGSGEINDGELFKNKALGHFVLCESKVHDKRVSQIDGVSGKSQTFGELCREAEILAASIQDLGIVPGDCISICCENRMEYSTVIIASMFAGTVLAPVNPTYTPDEIVHISNITNPKLMFCSAHTLKNVNLSLPQLEKTNKIVSFDKDSSDTVVNYSTLMNNRPIEKHCINKNDDVAIILASSGTTGLPKGVMLSYNNLKYFCCITVMTSFLNLKATDVILGLLPLFHGYGYGLLFTSILFGVKYVHVPKFEEKLFLSTIEKYRVNILCVVPPLMVFLGQHPLVMRYDLSSVRTVVCGAAPLATDTTQLVSVRLPQADIRQGYGMTESSIAITMSPPNSNRPESVGKLAAGLLAKVVDPESGRVVKRGESGELCVRGPCVMVGYCRDPQATSQVIDSSGWLHTGDIGYVDDEGYFFIIDRIKELIKYKGFQVAPAELEAILIGLGGVRDAAVVGRPDLVAGELPVAYIALQPGSTLTADDIISYVNGKIFDFKLNEEDVTALNDLDQGESARVVDFSFFKGLAEGHPEFPF